MTTDNYDPSGSLSAYYPSRAGRVLARIWSREKTLHDWADFGAVEFFEGGGSDPTVLTGYATHKLWLRVDEGVTDESATVHYYAGGTASSLSSWPELDRNGLSAHMARSGGELDFAWSTATSGDPGTGMARGNHATLSLITSIAISKTGRQGQDYASRIATWRSSDSLRLYAVGDGSAFVDVVLTSSPTDHSTYYAFNCSVNAASAIGSGVLVGVLHIATSASADAAAASAVTAANLKRGVYHFKRKSTPILIVATGQSNMLGSNNDLTGDNTTTDPNVHVWNWSLGATGEWQTSTPSVYPPYGNSYAKTNNLAHWLGMRLYAETGRDVYIVLRAQGSQSVVEWTTSYVTTDHFAFLANEVTQALLTPELADVTSDDIICLWGQGEQDAGMSTSTYRSHFYSVISRYKAEAWWSNRTPFLCIELPHDTAYATQNALHSNHHRYGIANILTVPTDGLGVDSSGVHYTGEGLQGIGYNRCFDTLMDYISNPPPFDINDPILAYPYPFASPADIRPGQPVDASNLSDLLLSSASGEHGIRSGNSPYSDLRGKTGYRTLIRGTLADGGSIPSDMPGGHLRLGGAATLPSTIPLGYTLHLQSVKSDGSCIVTAPSGAFGNDIDLTSSSIVLPLNGDSVTLVAYATDGTSWQVVDDNRRANVAGMINIPDDTAVSIKAPYNCGKISITANPNASSPNIQMQALIGYDVGATINIGKWAGGSLVAALAGDVSGTTGTDGIITVGGVSGYVRVENRTGGAIDLAWSWLM